MASKIATLRKNLRGWFWTGALIPPITNVCDRLRPKASLGAAGELAAERFLLRQGMIIIARGHQDKFGEIDLIAVDGETIVFVEVKTRSSDIAGHPAEAVDLKKQQRLTRAALTYLKWHRLDNVAARFDVIAVHWPPDAKRPRIEHYVNAFEAVGD